MNVLVAAVCDRNGNCGIKRLGRYRPLQGRGLEVAHRVHRRPVHAGLEVEVVPEAVPGAADRADHLALLTLAPFEVAKLDWWP